MSALSFQLVVPDEYLSPGCGLTKPIRMAGTPENQLFCLADICQVLGLQAPHMAAKQVDEDDRSQASVIDASGRRQMAWFVNESGLWTLVVRSDKENAKPFRRWVTKEVIPCIRKHGCYPAPTAVAPTTQPPGDSLQTTKEFLALCVDILGWNGMSERDRIILQDYARNRLLLDGNSTDRGRKFYTVTGRALEHFGVKLNRARNEDGICGKAVARVYRRKHNGQPPPQHEQTVDGRTTMVNTYTEADLPVLDEGISNYLNPGPLRISN